MTNWIDVTREIQWNPNREAIAGPVRLVNGIGEATLSKLLSRLGFQVFVIEGRVVRDESTLFNHIASVFGFPAYFGKNWDAFHDCFGDLCYARHQPIAILWRDSDVTCEQARREFYSAIVVFQETARGSQKGPEPLQIELFWLGDASRGYVAIPHGKAT